MGDIFGGILGILVKPKPVHSIPGRIRLHVPGLKQLSNRESEAIPLVTELTRLVPGIESIQPSFISGNILILYSIDEISESQVLHLFGAMARCAIHYRTKFLAVPENKRNKVFESIKEYIMNGTLERVLNGEELEIPDAVWN